MTGKKIHDLAKRLFPICRSITGNGVRETLSIIKDIIPNLEIIEIPSGTKVFDWTIPKEWNIKNAYIITPDGDKIANFKENNLHVVGYSAPVNLTLSLEELLPHLYSLSDLPDAIPYITSYYTPRWGFCIQDSIKQRLKSGTYQVVIDSELKEGHLTYAEIILPGLMKEEVFLSTYICHPSLANNELSGPCVATFLAKYINEIKNRKYTYRIVFIPETIGSITYLSKNLNYLKRHVIAGFNITCIGDNHCYSYLPSRLGNTLSDQVAKHVLQWTDANYKKYTWLERGSDERQYCSPGVDLPIATMMRSKYGEYPEYHTSLDNLDNVVTPEGLEGGYHVLKKAIEVLEQNCYPKINVLCEPQLGKRNLYPTLSTKSSGREVRLLMDFISFCDGHHSLLDIADKCHVPIWNLYPLMDKLNSHQLLENKKMNFPTCVA